MSGIIGKIQTNAAASKDVGFWGFGVNSGKKKDRVQLGGANDKTNRLAIACFADDEINGEGTEWVKLKLADGSEKKFEIKSMVARLGLSEDKILGLYKNKGESLENKINEIAAAYQKDLRIVEDFRTAVSTFLNSKDDATALGTFKIAFDQFNKDVNEVENKDIKQICDECKRDFNTVFINVEEYKANNVQQLDILIEIGAYKVNFEKSLRRFDKELFEIDRNFSVKSAENSLIRTLWGDTNLVLSKAKSMGLEATGRLATRLEFIKAPSNLFSILTTGIIFHQKPQATDNYVPYSKDGKTWVLLNIQSLASRLGIVPSKIIDASKNETLITLINDRVVFVEDCYKKINTTLYKRFNEIGHNKIEFDIYFKSYIEKLAKDHPSREYILTIANEIKADIDNHRITDIDNHRITNDNLSEFTEYGLLIKNNMVLITLGGKDHKVDVKTNGYFYKEKPEYNDEYLPFQFKKGFWILLNVESLQSGSDIPLGDIKYVLDDHAQLNDFINNSKK